MREYRIANERTGAVLKFTNYRLAGRYYRRGSKAGQHFTASTWKEAGDDALQA